MRLAGTLIALVLCAAAATTATAASPFAYWIFSLSWTPEYCRNNLTSKEPQCTEHNEFVPEDLRPHVSGPEYTCETGESVPKDLIDRMVVTMQNISVIKKVWKKSGACSNLSVSDYFLQLERAGRKINVPSDYRDLAKDLETTPAEVKAAFMKVNDGLDANEMLLECDGKYLEHVRFCLDSNFDFRQCGLDIEEDCRSDIRVRRLNSRFLPKK